VPIQPLPAPWSFLPLTRDFDRQNFDCGKPALNDYLKVTANQHQKSNISRTTVAVPSAVSADVSTESKPKIAGFYTLNASKIDIKALPEANQKGLPKRLDIPAIKIGQLAVDQRYSGQGLGESLLMDALYKCYSTSHQLAVNSVVVDAYDDEAKAFWLRYDFITFRDRPQSLFLPIKTIQKLFDD
jgi:GNAT superfamily N-acetyltransferase